MEERKIEWKVTESEPACRMLVDNEKIVLIIGDDEMIAANPMTNSGETPIQFFDRFLEGISLEEE
ncbi:hypothetical protein [Mesotoga sp. UBA6090]|uniref:hypothetical protein n=1 Tax=Mesotoga sp. UBA6090 TaxID=1946860 RepID=UPI0025D6AC3F|nr:hypothetical protein [Mesotoga sp. UBA6090]